MPACPYENHRLRLDARGHCDRCGGDLRLYAALLDTAASLYNDARRYLDAGDLATAAACAAAALRIRETFPEAHLLLAAIEARRGLADRAADPEAVPSADPDTAPAG